MSRTIVSVVGRDRTFVMLDAAAADIEMDDLSEVNLAGIGESGTLAERGDALLRVITTDAAVRRVLDALLTNGNADAPSPIYFHVRASVADAVIWEQLHAHQRFVALDERWPIGRIARQSQNVELRAFAPPLRVVAVLAAAGRSGLAQLTAVSDACRASAVPAALHVISGDADLAPEVAARGATFEQIGISGPALLDQVVAARPHLLHLLCHGGGTAAGVRMLAFANANDVDAAQLDPTVLGSIRVSAPQLVQALVPGSNPWLVVLGACESAAADAAAPRGQSLALAHELASGGIPAVIGMRRLVDIAATDTFCREFYPDALALVADTLRAVPGEPDPARELDWAQALTRPRQVLGTPDPEQVDAWTDPVLYAQHSALRVFVAAPADDGAGPGPAPLTAAEHAEIAGKIDRLKGGLAALVSTDGAPEVIAEVTARIKALQAQIGQL